MNIIKCSYHHGIFSGKQRSIHNIATRSRNDLIWLHHKNEVYVNSFYRFFETCLLKHRKPESGGQQFLKYTNICEALTRNLLVAYISFEPGNGLPIQTHLLNFWKKRKIQKRVASWFVFQFSCCLKLKENLSHFITDDDHYDLKYIS